VPIFEFDGLAPGQTVAGPAVIEAATTTVLLRPGERAQVTEIGWLDIALTNG
jgi:N-methylhydantoinase A